jgi:hypothetical protein
VSDDAPLPPSGYPAPSGYPPPAVPSAPSAWDTPGPGSLVPPGGPMPPPPGYAPAPGGYGYVPGGQPRKTPGLAVAALVCGLVGILIANFILGPLALIFGAVSLRQINASPATLKGRGLAIAGIVLCFVDIAVFVVVLSLQDELQEWIDRNR